MADIWGMLESIPLLGRAVEALKDAIAARDEKLSSLVAASLKSQTKISRILKDAGQVLEDAQARIESLEVRVSSVEKQLAQIEPQEPTPPGADVSGVSK